MDIFFETMQAIQNGHRIFKKQDGVGGKGGVDGIQLFQDRANGWRL
jgi:hypothetical protein